MRVNWHSAARETRSKPRGGGTTDSLSSPLSVGRARFADYLWSGLAVILLTIFGKAVEPWVGYPSIDLFYLVPVILAATLFGLRPGIAAGIASGILYNFFFLPPLHTFVIHDPQDVITATVLVLVAIVTSQLAGRVRTQARVGEQRAQENAAIAGFVGTLGMLSEEAETAQTICSEVARLFEVQVVLLDVRDDQIRVVAVSPGAAELAPTDIKTADQVFKSGEAAFAAGTAANTSRWQFWPLKGSLGTLAILGIHRPGATRPVPDHRSVMFSNVIDRAARAYERLKVEEEMRHVAALRERDHLRATLLSTIGHDLRTPLTAVTAAAEALQADDRNQELVGTIRTEARRLSRFFDDLIDITRIESGALAPRLEPVDLTDAVTAALDDVRMSLEERSVRTDVPANLPLVQTDPNFLHHILINLLVNASKFSPPGSEIRLTGMQVEEGLRLSISDEGPGLPPGREAAVFDTFTRLEGSDRTGGTGLGLAIVKGFAEAMNLSVDAGNRLDRQGARFSILFPRPLLRPASEDE